MAISSWELKLPSGLQERWWRWHFKWREHKWIISWSRADNTLCVITLMWAQSLLLLYIVRLFLSSFLFSIIALTYLFPPVQSKSIIPVMVLLFFSPYSCIFEHLLLLLLWHSLSGGCKYLSMVDNIWLHNTTDVTPTNQMITLNLESMIVEGFSSFLSTHTCDLGQWTSTIDFRCTTKIINKSQKS